MFVSRGWMSMLAAQSNYNDTRCVPDSEAYITALYFTTTSLTTVGFGNVAANTKESFVVAISGIDTISLALAQILPSTTFL